MTADICERLGVRRWINAGGYLTRMGGAPLAPEVLEAMRAVSRESVDLSELQAAASAAIVPHTGTEAAIVTSGAAAALTLASAAVIARLDAAPMDRLPDTAGMANEIVMHRTHRSSYDHAIRAAGARIAAFGVNDIGLDAGFRGIEAWDAESAVTEATVAFAFAASPRNLRDLETVAKVADRHGLPVIADAAPWLPPAENLRRFSDAGATLVAFSGGKALGAPGGTGILSGPRDLIASALLQQIDMTTLPETWHPPAGLVPREKLTGMPRHGIGRGLKVSKEDIAGLVAALELFITADQSAVLAKQEALLADVSRALATIGSVVTQLRNVAETGLRPLLDLKVDEAALGRTCVDISNALKTGAPPIQLDESGIRAGILTVDPACLHPDDAPLLVERLQSVLDKPG